MPDIPVAYLGPRGSFTHQACRQVFDDVNYEHVSCGSIEDVFKAVQNGSAPYGVVPLENSTNGVVTWTFDYLTDKAGHYPDIQVTGETRVAVQHCLVGHKASSQPEPTNTPRSTSPSLTSRLKEQTLSPGSNASSSGSATPTPANPNPVQPRSRPLTDISHIKALHSHPQAWGQCDYFLSRYLKNIPRFNASSTSAAAGTVANDAEGTSAAVCSEFAAENYDLDVLARGIEDDPNNETRFLVLRKGGDGAEVGARGPAKGRADDEAQTGPQIGNQTGSQNKAETAVKTRADGAANTTAKNSPDDEAGSSTVLRSKTLLAFTVTSHTQPGALADPLSVFKKHGINLTHINTRPSGDEKWHYIHFVEIQGRKGDENVDDALEELATLVKKLKYLGSWTSSE